ncbi:MAG TPA: 4'-phosphopantetheinyl transferase superfamily protein [Reyranella sp.]|nr:4'-phosphopantetheinyl transferase superfamily protein [Reyranella sp.]
MAGNAHCGAGQAIDVSWVRLEDGHVLASRWGNVLDLEEREQRQRFRRAEDRELYALAHILLRVALSQHAAVSPESWSFVRGAYGKPELAPALAKATGLHFSLAHSAATAVCAVRFGAPVGIDVEPVDRPIDPIELADMVLGPSEKMALLELEDDARRRRFLALWTLKEAYVKAVGLGLTFSVTDCMFDLERSEVRFASHVTDDPAAWWFDHVLLDGRDFVSVAARRHDSVFPSVHYSHCLRGASDTTSRWMKSSCDK